VPEVIIASINPPDDLEIIGTPKMIEARAVKAMDKGRKKEFQASHLSEKIFFIEYYLHM
jgi:hypothetical protein